MFDALSHPGARASAHLPLQQSGEYVAALDLMGQTPLRLEDGTVVLQRQIGPLRLAMLPRCMPDGLRMLRAARGWRRTPALIVPDAPWAGPGVPLVSPAHVATLDLRAGVGVLEGGLHGKWRNRLRKAQQAELRIGRRDLSPRAGQWLFEREAAMQNTRKYRNWPNVLTLAYAQANTGKAVLFTATSRGAVVAAMLFLLHGASASYHMGHSSNPGRLLNAHTAVMWKAICWLHVNGIQSLELGYIDTQKAPGLARFKLGTGAQARALGGAWFDWPVLRPLDILGRIDRAMMHSRSTL